MKEKYLLTINKGILPLLFVGLIFTGFASILSSAVATSPVNPAEKISLKVYFKATAESKAKTYSIVCFRNTVSGTHPNRVKICNFLKKNKTNSNVLFSLIPKGEMRTMIYGGPELAKISGAYKGRTVSARYSRDNGCAISRWDNAKAFFTFRLT